MRIFSCLAIQGPLEQRILPSSEWFSSHEVFVDFDPTTVLLSRLREGDIPDALFCLRPALDEPLVRQLFDWRSAFPIARSGLGLAVKAGHEHPPVASQEQFIVALTSARSVAYSRAGASGIYFTSLIERLGIATEVEATATVLPKGLTATALIDGRADLAVQQMSELRAVGGVELVGPFPPELQQFSDVVGVARNESAAEALRQALNTADARGALEDFGLLPL